MPIREYQVKAGEAGCPACRQPFERMERLGGAPLERCAACGAALERLISAPRVGRSQSGFDARARAAGFHKLARRGRGEYEAQY